MKNKLTIGISSLAIAATASIAAAEVNQPQEIIMRPMTTPASPDGSPHPGRVGA